MRAGESRFLIGLFAQTPHHGIASSPKRAHHQLLRKTLDRRLNHPPQCDRDAPAQRDVLLLEVHALVPRLESRNTVGSPNKPAPIVASQLVPVGLSRTPSFLDASAAGGGIRAVIAKLGQTHFV